MGYCRSIYYTSWLVLNFTTSPVSASSLIKILVTTRVVAALPPYNVQRVLDSITTQEDSLRNPQIVVLNLLVNYVH